MLRNRGSPFKSRGDLQSIRMLFPLPLSQTALTCTLECATVQQRAVQRLRGGDFVSCKTYINPLIIASLSLGWGCASQEAMDTSTATLSLNSGKSIAVTSVPEDFQSFITTADRICVLPTPPASFGDTGPKLTVGADSVDTGSVTSSNRDLGGSTYLTDQILYRLCELGLNYDFTKEEMKEYFIESLQRIDEITGKNFDDSVLANPNSTSKEKATGAN